MSKYSYVIVQKGCASLEILKRPGKSQNSISQKSSPPIKLPDQHTCSEGDAPHSHDHSHDEHNHDHGGQSHNHSLQSDDIARLGTKLKIGLTLTLAFAAIEFGTGLFSNSLALVSDAGHNLSDALALGFSWFAVVLARRAPTSSKTFGFHRAGILAASLNSLTLVLISAYIIYEGLQRLFEPRQVESGPVIAVAALALLVNLYVARLLHSDSHDLNMRSAFIHIATDAAVSLGVILAAIGQALSGWLFFDPLVSIVIGLVVLGSCWGIVKESTNVLLEGSPAGLDMQALLFDLKKLDGVQEAHDLHVWTIGSGLPALSCHLQMEASSTLSQITATIQNANEMLKQKYQIRHTTIQIEGDCQQPCDILKYTSS